MQLTDYEEWRSRNSKKGSFDLADYIHGVFDYKNIHEDLCFAFLNLIWPEFIEVDGMVFIKDSYQAKKQNISMEAHKLNSETEFWINLLTLDDFLHIKDAEKQTFLVTKLGESWKAKLKQDFPSLNFKITIADDEDDLGISFHQE